MSKPTTFPDPLLLLLLIQVETHSGTRFFSPGDPATNHGTFSAEGGGGEKDHIQWTSDHQSNSVLNQKVKLLKFPCFTQRHEA